MVLACCIHAGPRGHHRQGEAAATHNHFSSISRASMSGPWQPRRVLLISVVLLPLVQFKEYLARAEYLKGVSGQDSGGPENGNVTAAQKVRKPGVGGKDDVSHEWHGRGLQSLLEQRHNL